MTCADFRTLCLGKNALTLSMPLRLCLMAHVECCPWCVEWITDITQFDQQPTNPDWQNAVTETAEAYRKFVEGT